MITDPNAQLPQADAHLEMLSPADSPGNTCALLTPAIHAKLRELQGGQVLEVRVDDPTAAEDVAAWSRLSGHSLLAMINDGAWLRFLVRKKAG